MSQDADTLADMARNRGLKLKRSRVRTEGKPGFGMFGLTKTDDTPVFGIRGKRALRATAEEIADFLRKGEASDWSASLKEVGGRARPRSAAAKPIAPKRPAPVKASAQAAPPPPALRDAKPTDAPELAALFNLLGHVVSPDEVRANLLLLRKAGEPVLVMAQGKRVVGACAYHRTVMPQHPYPVGRITHLVVAEDARRHGIGQCLLAEAEARLRKLGCAHVEVTSNDRLTPAHSFYRAHGYERTSIRFAKRLASS